ncbi:YggT family protein [Paenibacillus solisilvae]|uniref:YggT family protein n=1 Tax=Paenibacillus solisilvae TaxID=2486751 RepID=A0ABW0W2H8_9BACL
MSDSATNIIYTLSEIYSFLIIGYILLSWLPSVRESFVGELLGKIVEPYLTPFRRIIPPIGGMLDISPIVALFALRFVTKGIDAIVHLFI